MKQYFEKSQDIFIRLTNYFEANKINYCVLGDTRSICNADQDVDIVLSKKAFEKIFSLILKFCRNYGLRLIQVFNHEQTAKCFVLSWKDNNNAFNFFKADFCSDFLKSGKLFLSSKELIECKQKISNKDQKDFIFYVLAPEKNFIYYLLKKIDNGELNGTHAKFLSSEFKKNPEGASNEILRFWPKKEAYLIINGANRNEWEDITSVLPLLKMSFQLGLAFSLNNYVNEIIRKINRLSQPTGLQIAILGTDGSGKSTIVEEIKQNLFPAFKHTQSYHLRPHMIRLKRTEMKVTNPHEKLKWPLFLSILKLIIWWVDYTVGYYFKVYPKLVCSTFVVFDRYYYDLLVDTRRYRYGGPLWLAKIVGRLLPKPDLWILLNSPPDVFQSRKKEISYEETNRQCKAYLKLAKQLKNCTVVDASLPVGQVVVNVNNAILDFLTERTEGRLGY
jgi:thymidylate kinase